MPSPPPPKIKPTPGREAAAAPPFLLKSHKTKQARRKAAPLHSHSRPQANPCVEGIIAAGAAPAGRRAQGGEEAPALAAPLPPWPASLGAAVPTGRKAHSAGGRRVLRPQQRGLLSEAPQKEASRSGSGPFVRCCRCRCPRAAQEGGRGGSRAMLLAAHTYLRCLKPCEPSGPRGCRITLQAGRASSGWEILVGLRGQRERGGESIRPPARMSPLPPRRRGRWRHWRGERLSTSSRRIRTGQGCPWVRDAAVLPSQLAPCPPPAKTQGGSPALQGICNEPEDWGPLRAREGSWTVCSNMEAPGLHVQT